MYTKYFSFLIAFFVLSISSFGQSQGFNYKAIISDNGSILQNQSVIVRFIILENGVTPIYQETHTKTTDENGLLIAIIGEGDGSDDFSAIDWSDTQFLNVAYNTGSGYVDMGTTAFNAVPYAKYSNHAAVADYVSFSFWNQISNGINSNDPIGIGIPATLDANLHIADVTGGLPLIKMKSDDNVYTIWQSDRSGVDDYLIGIDGGNNRFLFANTTTGDYPLVLKDGKVGVNNLTPTANLDVNGSFKIADGTQGNGKILTSDASGNTSWETMPAILTTTLSKYYSPVSVVNNTNLVNYVKSVKEFYVTESAFATFYVPIDLPIGATITDIEYLYYDNDPIANLKFTLSFSNISTGSFQAFYFTNHESSGASDSVASGSISGTYDINDGYNYSFMVYPTSGEWPGDNTLSFRGIKITYTMPTQ